jgi:hypothetical protein
LGVQPGDEVSAGSEATVDVNGANQQLVTVASDLCALELSNHLVLESS